MHGNQALEQRSVQEATVFAKFKIGKTKTDF